MYLSMKTSFDAKFSIELNTKKDTDENIEDKFRKLGANIERVVE